MPVVELVIPSLSESDARAVADACADAACWPVRLVRRGLVRRQVALELADTADGVAIDDPPAGTRVAATVRELTRRFAHVEVVPSEAPLSDPVPVTLGEFEASVCTCGLDVTHGWVVRPGEGHVRRVPPAVAGGEALDAAWDRIEAWLTAHHPLGLRALRPGTTSDLLDPSWPPALRRSLRRHDGQALAAGAIAEGHFLLSTAEIRASGCIAAGPETCLRVDAETGAVLTTRGVVQAPSLESWLTRWADELESGEQRLDASGDVVLV